MVQNPPEGSQRIIPYLNYADPRAAIDFISQAFGFEVSSVLESPDGSVGHAELQRDNEIIMLGGAYEPHGLNGAANLSARHASVCLYVDDLDTHFEVAKAAGAEVVQEPAEQFYGDRTYRVNDPEGVGWDVHQHIRDVTQEEMMAATADMFEQSES